MFVSMGIESKGSVWCRLFISDIFKELELNLRVLLQLHILGEFHSMCIKKEKVKWPKWGWIEEWASHKLNQRQIEKLTLDFGRFWECRWLCPWSGRFCLSAHLKPSYSVEDWGIGAIYPQSPHHELLSLNDSRNMSVLKWLVGITLKR